ncbi:hypothetical protein NKG05_10110 [Oerskovia sp. M15]
MTRYGVSRARAAAGRARHRRDHPQPRRRPERRRRGGGRGGPRGGHHVMLSSGRSLIAVLPIAERLGLAEGTWCARTAP